MKRTLALMISVFLFLALVVGFATAGCSERKKEKATTYSTSKSTTQSTTDSTTEETTESTTEETTESTEETTESTTEETTESTEETTESTEETTESTEETTESTSESTSIPEGEEPYEVKMVIEVGKFPSGDHLLRFEDESGVRTPCLGAGCVYCSFYNGRVEELYVHVDNGEVSIELVKFVEEETTEETTESTEETTESTEETIETTEETTESTTEAETTYETTTESTTEAETTYETTTESTTEAETTTESTTEAETTYETTTESTSTPKGEEPYEVNKVIEVGRFPTGDHLLRLDGGEGIRTSCLGEGCIYCEFHNGRVEELYVHIDSGEVSVEQVKFFEEETPSETVPEEETPSESVPEEETPSESVPEEETPSETVPEEETSSESVPEVEIPSESTMEVERPSTDVTHEVTKVLEIGKFPTGDHLLRLEGGAGARTPCLGEKCPYCKACDSQAEVYVHIENDKVSVCECN